MVCDPHSCYKATTLFAFIKVIFCSFEEIDVLALMAYYRNKHRGGNCLDINDPGCDALVYISILSLDLKINQWKCDLVNS